MNKRPLRILYVTSCWPHDRAYGGQLRALHIGRALKQFGQVTLVLVGAHDADLQVRMRTAAEFEIGREIKVVTASARGLVSRLGAFFNRDFTSIHGIVAEPKDEAWLIEAQKRFDLIWFFKLRTADYFKNARWQRSVVDIDDLPSTMEESRWRNGPGLGLRLKARLRMIELRRHESHLGGRFSVLAVCSEADRATLGAGLLPHVIPNAFGRPVATPVRKLSQPPRIGFMGLYSYEPNLEGVRWFINHCWNRIKTEVPGVRLRLVGEATDGSLKPNDSSIDGLGWVENPDEEVASWSLMIVPIWIGAGTRVKIADAFSRKCPVVSTRLGALGYDVQNGRELFLADDPQEFAAACVTLIKDPKAAADMADRGFSKFLENWTWDAVAPRIGEAVEDCRRRNFVRGPDLESQTARELRPFGVEQSHSTPQVSVLITTYNRASVLKKTLENMALVDREGVSVEWVIIDNNSDDSTKQIVQSFMGRLPIVYLFERNPGKNCALNKALRECVLGDLVVFADDDITPQSDWLKQIVAASERWPDLPIFGAKVVVGWPDGKQPDWVVADWVKVFGFAWHDLGDQELRYGPNVTPMGPCFWVRKEVFSKVASFDETIGPRPSNRIMGSEVSFLLDMERHGFKMVYCPEVKVEHRIQPTECSLRALMRRAYRYGRGQARLYGIHRSELLKQGKLVWGFTMVADVLYYSGIRFVGGVLAPSKRQRAEFVLRAMVRAGTIAESRNMLSGHIF